MYRVLRLGWRFVTVGLINALSMLIAVVVIPGIAIETRPTGILGAVSLAMLIGLANALVRPMLVYLTFRVNWITIGVPTVIIDALLLMSVGNMMPGVRVDEFWPSALLGAVILPACNIILSSLTNPERQRTLYDFVLRRLGRATPADKTRPSGRGLIMVQIDGLSYTALRHALRQGRLPALQALLNEGQHAVLAWDCNVPSQTSSTQAGILFGDRSEIPAFRWYDREESRVVVCNRPDGAALIEGRLAGRPGLLVGGSSVNNILSGGAASNVFTVSVLSSGQPGTRRAEELLLFLLNPYCMLRVVALALLDLLMEYWGAWRQRLRKKKPRVSRRGLYPLLRVLSNVVLRELSTYFVLLDVMRGAPCIYVTYLGFDEVCHHAGPFSPDLHGPLEGIDHQIRRIRKIVKRDAPIPYDLIVLSDHGQSESIPFRQQHGMELEELILSLAAGELRMGAGQTQEELPGQLLALLEDLREAERLSTGRLLPMAFRRSRSALQHYRGRLRTDLPAEDSDLLVLCSGNLAHVYCARTSLPLSLEEVEARHPLLVTELARHPGIGFVLGRSESRGLLAIGSAGFRQLENDLVVGVDPLEPFGDLNVIVGQLRRLISYRNTGDLVVNSIYQEGHVLSFEEHVGAHGGLGGPQTQAFFIYPVGMTINATAIGGPEDLYPILRRWREQTRSQTIS